MSTSIAAFSITGIFTRLKKKLYLPENCIYLFFTLIVTETEIPAQTNADKITGKLESLTVITFDSWKYTTDFSKTSAELSKPGFDDSKWQTLNAGERKNIDSCWLRKVVTIPEYLAGQPVNDSLIFCVSVDDFGYLFINGEAKGYFPWDGEFVIPEARSGSKYVLLIKAVNTAGPMRLLRAQLKFKKNSVAEMIEDLVISLKTGQKLLSFDTEQGNDRIKFNPLIDKSKMDKSEKEKLNKLLQNTAKKINITSLEKGESKKFIKSYEAVKNELKPVSEFASQFTLQFTANAHIDAAWLWRKKETVEVCRSTFSSVMNMFNAREKFSFSQSAAVYYEWMEQLYPELFNRIQDKVKEGRWEITGGQWVETDCNLPAGESWYRQFLYAQKYFQSKFGKRAAIGWNPDSFGYNLNLPMFLKNSHITAFITQKLGWNDTNVFPYRLFWWQSPDSSRVLTYFPFSYINTIDNPYSLVEWLRQFEANTGLTRLMILFGIGNHGGGPSIEMMGRIDKLDSLIIFPKVEYGTAGDYFDFLQAQINSGSLADIPVWEEELYLEYHRGTLTTQSDTKKWNRHCEMLLTNAEKLNSLSLLLGDEYKQNDLTTAWKNVLFNQFHDILPGSGINEVYYDAEQDYKLSDEIGRQILGSSLNFITDKISTSGIDDGIPVVVFNTLSWERSGVASLDLPYADKSHYSVVDEEGREIPSQVIFQSKYKDKIIFPVENIPSVGYKVYGLIRKEAEENESHRMSQGNLSVSDNTLENEFFRITIDPDSGWIKSIYDKNNKKEVFNSGGNKLQLLEDRPAEWDAWNIGLTGVEYPSTFRKTEIVENGPVRVRLRLYRDYLKPGVKKSFPTEDFPNSFMIQDIILYRGSDQVDFITTVEWWEEKTMLKAVFPVAVNSSYASYEIPYGIIKRSTLNDSPVNKARWETAGLKWADLSEDSYGVSLLNKAKYGYDIKGNTIRLSLLRSPKWPDKMADMGNHSIEYALYPHKGNGLDKTIRKGYEYNCPFITVLAEDHGGELPSEHSFIKITPSNLLLTAVKKAEDSEAMMIQFYESSGRDSDAEVTLPAEIRNALLSDFLEEDLEPLTAAGNSVKLRVRANSVNTIKVYFGKDRQEQKEDTEEGIF